MRLNAPNKPEWARIAEQKFKVKPSLTPVQYSDLKDILRDLLTFGSSAQARKIIADKLSRTINAGLSLENMEVHHTAGTFYKSNPRLEYSTVIFTEAEFREVLLRDMPTELWCFAWSIQKPFYTLEYFGDRNDPTIDLTCEVWADTTKYSLTVKQVFEQVSAGHMLKYITYTV